METLKWLAEYGLIDIFFGLGVVGMLAGLMRKVLPSNYEQLHTSVVAGGPMTIQTGPVGNSIQFQIKNAGTTNFYIARVYFRAERRSPKKLWLGWRKTPLRVNPDSARIAEKKNAFELKFLGQQAQFLTDLEALIRPGSSNSQTTWLALEEPLPAELIESRNCGILYIEYATQGKQGTHVIRV